MSYQWEELPPPEACEYELPQFYIREEKMGMSHHEWLNLALAGMYRVWHEHALQGDNVSMKQLIEHLGRGNKFILYKLAHSCELIENKGHFKPVVRGAVTVSAGCLTEDGAERVITSYKNTYNKRKP